MNFRALNDKSKSNQRTKSTVFLRKMTFQEFYVKYLHGTHYDTRDFKNHSRMELQILPKETFALCWDNSEVGRDNVQSVKILVDSLRLFGYSHVEMGMEFLFAGKNNANYDPGTIIHSTVKDSFYTMEEKLFWDYISLINSENRAHFGAFLKLFPGTWESIFKKSYIQIAFRHFLSSLSRIEGVEQVLNLIISIEALLSPKSKIELRYRISHYAASLIGKNRDEREKIFYIVGQGYDIRSDLAHGDFNNFDNKSYFKKLNEPDDTCIEYLRNIVRDVLTRCMILNLEKDNLRIKLEEDNFGLINSLHKNSNHIKGYEHDWRLNN